MGEGKNRVDEPDPEQLGEKVEQSRERLDSLVAELDHRRHVFARLGQAWRDKPAWVLGGAVALTAILAGTAVLLVQRQKREQRLVARARRVKKALRRRIEGPDRHEGRDPDAVRRIATSAASTAAAMLTRRLVERLLPDPR